MKNIFLVNYSVKGIKTLDKVVSLSFYKKTITESMSTQEYSIKGIYGMNGSGKSGIVTSVSILKNLLTNSGYLNNPIVQKNLEAIINKSTEELFIEADYIVKSGKIFKLYRYGITLSKDRSGKYIISSEEFSLKNATSKSDSMEQVYKVINGQVVSFQGEGNDEFRTMILERSFNLLENTSMSALFSDKILTSIIHKPGSDIASSFVSLCTLFVFGKILHVYMDEADDHTDYFVNNSEHQNVDRDSLLKDVLAMDDDWLETISVIQNVVSKGNYEQFEAEVTKLYKFLRIFKPDLQKIDIDKKEDHDVFICDLIMVYDSYKIHAEFESTGIKKLIRLYKYLKEMMQGGIVFIDEFDSNLHDVYLCALLEYLMEYGKGQLCFTTHNIGPMDVLKKNKKSIDFLSLDRTIYSWTANGNYSPSKLYKNGMIEGSPFNIDSIDFIGVLGVGEEDE